jgi:hypothetical protein
VLPHELRVGLDLFGVAQRRRAHAHADGDERVVAVHGARVRAEAVRVAADEDREALAPDVLDRVAREAALVVRLPDGEEILDHLLEIRGVAAVVGRLKIGVFRLGDDWLRDHHRGRLRRGRRRGRLLRARRRGLPFDRARLLEQRGGLEVE